MPFFIGDKVHGVFLLFLPLAIAVFGVLEGYFSLTITALGEFEVVVPKYKNVWGKWELRSLDSLFKEVTVFKEGRKNKTQKNFPRNPSLLFLFSLSLPFFLPLWSAEFLSRKYSTKRVLEGSTLWSTTLILLSTTADLMIYLFSPFCRKRKFWQKLGR